MSACKSRRETSYQKKDLLLQTQGGKSGFGIFGFFEIFEIFSDFSGFQHTIILGENDVFFTQIFRL